MIVNFVILTFINVSVLLFFITKIPFFIFPAFVFNSLQKHLQYYYLLICVTILFKNILLLIAFNSGVYIIRELFLGLDFILIVFFAFILSFKDLKFHKSYIIILLISLLYLILSFTNGNFIKSLQTFRLLVLPFLIYIISRHLYNFNVEIEPVIKVLVFAVFLYLAVEALLPNFYEIINIENYKYIKWGEGARRVSSSYLDKMGTYIFGIRINRLLGPTLHPITLGYFMSFSFVYLLGKVKKINSIFLFLFFVLIALLTSKGSLTIILFIFFCDFFQVKRKLYIVFLLIIYTVSMLLFASFPISSGYTHFMTLKQSLTMFLSNPFGYWIEYTSTYDTFFGLLLVSVGIFAFFYYYNIIKYILKSSLNYLFDRELKLMSLFMILLYITSILQVEPITISSMFMPFTYWFYLIFKFREYREE